MAVPPGSEPGEVRRTYPDPSQPIPPPAPGPSSPLSAIFARSLLFPMMGATVTWAVLLAVSAVLGTHLLPASDIPYSMHWRAPVVALVGCGAGLLIWVVGLVTCWRRPVLWAWVAAGAVVVAAGTVAYLVLLLG
ncbi:MAG TPA: hypothetical protein VK060_01040 [Ruania sp.]|nr:hypothetical protein [Ruania sp.]